MTDKILIADYIYILFVGPDNIITQFCEKLNDNYIKHKLDIPCVEILYSDTKYLDKIFIIDEGVETSHCLTYAEIISEYKNTDPELMLLLKINNMHTHYNLSFPIIQLEKEEKPEILISEWLKKNNVNNLIKKINIRPIDIVKNKNSILVFLAFITNN